MCVPFRAALRGVVVRWTGPVQRPTSLPDPSGESGLPPGRLSERAERVQLPRPLDRPTGVHHVSKLRREARLDEPQLPVVRRAGDPGVDRVTGGTQLAELLVDECELEVRRVRPWLDAAGAGRRRERGRGVVPADGFLALAKTLRSDE